MLVAYDSRMMHLVRQNSKLVESLLETLHRDKVNEEYAMDKISAEG